MSSRYSSQAFLFPRDSPRAFLSPEVWGKARLVGSLRGAPSSVWSSSRRAGDASRRSAFQGMRGGDASFNSRHQPSLEASAQAAFSEGMLPPDALDDGGTRVLKALREVYAALDAAETSRLGNSRRE